MLSAHYWSANVNTAALVAAMLFGALGTTGPPAATSFGVFAAPEQP